ncbi:MAG: hypothetical protein ACEPOW_03855 [Bacteroidales bacterium]
MKSKDVKQGFGNNDALKLNKKTVNKLTNSKITDIKLVQLNKSEFTYYPSCPPCYQNV